MLDIEGLVAEVGELLHNEASVEEVKAALGNVISALNDDPFEYMATIQPDSFGTTESARNLTHHHRLAQEVMNETLQGFKKDMHTLLSNVKKASELVSHIDQSSGDTMKKRQAMLEALRYIDGHSSAASAHTQAVNNQGRPHGAWPGSSR